MKEAGFREALATSQGNAYAKWPARHSENRLEPECWPGLTPSFAIEPKAKIFAIGSCFARNVERYLFNAGYDVPTRRFLQQSHENSDISGEILNKYTPPSIWQELSWTRQILDRDGIVRPEDIEDFLLPLTNGKVIDLQRRFVDRFGLTRDEALAQRRSFFDLFRQAFDADVVIITLGLVECWWDSRAGQYIEMSAMLADYNQDSRFSFRRLDYPECYDFTKRSIDLLNGGGEKHILITTSPVPIARTFTADDVIVANTYSKSVLRAVAGKIAEETPGTDYFPSYESVMLTRRPELWEDDMAHVESAFIDRIMRRVEAAYVGEARLEADGALEEAVSRLANLVKHAQWDEAGEVLAAIGVLHPDGADVAVSGAYHVNAASYLVHAGQLDLARGQLEKVEALSARPKAGIRAEEHFQCAKLWDVLGEGARAAALRRGALDTMISRPPALKAWIRTLLVAHEMDDALFCMAYAEALPEAGGDVLDFLAHHYQAIGRLEDAERTSARALQLEADSVLIAMHRVSLLHKLGREDEAKALAARLEATGKETPRFLRRAAAELIKARRCAEAEPALARLLEIDPDEPQNHALLARCHLHAGRPQEALAAARRAHDLKPEDKFQRLIGQAESAIAVRARKFRANSARKDPADAVA